MRPQPHTKNDRNQKSIECSSSRQNMSIVIQYQVTIPGDIHTSYITQTEQDVLMYLGKKLKMHVWQQLMKKVINFGNSKAGYIDGFGRKRGKGK